MTFFCPWIGLGSSRIAFAAFMQMRSLTMMFTATLAKDRITQVVVAFPGVYAFGSVLFDWNVINSNM